MMKNSPKHDKLKTTMVLSSIIHVLKDRYNDTSCNLDKWVLLPQVSDWITSSFFNKM